MKAAWRTKAKVHKMEDESMNTKKGG